MPWDLIGHTWAAELLQEHIARGQVRHAYLITGPQGAGRRTLAMGLAQSLNCPQPSAPGQPCLTCPTCRRIRDMAYPDLSVVQAETVGGMLKVDQIRELQHILALSPYAARYRVALLLRFEEANDSAANALLKTLEEPNPQVVLAITAESPERLLPTIVSRCEVLRLRPLPAEEVSRGLQERREIPVQEAQLLAHISGGRPGYAIRLLEHPEILEQRRSWLDDLNRLLDASRLERFAYVEPLYRDKDSVRSLLQVWSSFWHDVFLQVSGSATPVTNIDRGDEIGALATQFDLHSARQIISRFERAIDLLDRNVNARLILEVLMLDLPFLQAV